MILFLVLISLVFVDGRSFHLVPSNILDGSQEINVEYKVLPRSFLKIHKNDDDQQTDFHLGQVSGLAANLRNPNILHIFHRASRHWTEQSFPDGINFDQDSFGPIKENTLINVDIRTGSILKQWANSSFSMPHGLSSDREGNLWLTDVAMHQVFKYGDDQLLLTLGEEFVPGNDEKHFCKPTDVVVTNDGSKIFVADGYCNSRIAVFDSNGNYLRQYSIKNGGKQLKVPHSLLLIETLDLLCVADRENRRIVCFDSGLNQEDGHKEGEIRSILTNEDMGPVFAITYDSNKERIYAVTGSDRKHRSLGFTFSADENKFGQLIKIWKPIENFGEPHDLTLNVNGQHLFVGQIHPQRINLFDIVN